MQNTLRIIFFCCTFIVFGFHSIIAQKNDSTIKRNVSVMASCSILEGNGYRVELPSFFYGSRRHAVSIAPVGKITSDNTFYAGASVGYFCFIEPSFRDITFYLTYNLAYFFQDNIPVTHIVGIGTQIDIGKRGFIQHSVGFGFKQSITDLSSAGPAGQLKLSLGFYIREIRVVHIHDDWEH